jgi:DNA-directed RNA polymerase subunit M/transcription elongation factor TFIIS
MSKIICPHCGNSKKFREWILIHRYNYFVQEEDGKVFKNRVEEEQDNEKDSVIVCEVCGQELEGELYHQFLDNYTETIFQEV